jgi:hypothetical protein
LYTFSLAVVKANGDYEYLLNKDVNFIREAYPGPAVTGLPKHYANFDDTAFILGPTPDAAYTVELHYGYYPESIVTAGTTWLGDEFDSALLNGALLEAIRFMKGEPDIIANYEKLYLQAIGLIKMLGDDTGTTQVYKLALYTANASLGAATTAYTTDGEIIGTGYVAGGDVLTVAQIPTSSGTTAYINFSDVTWTGAVFVARGGLIYLEDGITNPSVAVLDFGADKSTTPAGVFNVQFPTSSASTSIIRLA